MSRRSVFKTSTSPSSLLVCYITVNDNKAIIILTNDLNPGTRGHYWWRMLFVINKEYSIHPLVREIISFFYHLTSPRCVPILCRLHCNIYMSLIYISILLYWCTAVGPLQLGNPNIFHYEQGPFFQRFFFVLWFVSQFHEIPSVHPQSGLLVGWS